MSYFPWFLLCPLCPLTNLTSNTPAAYATEAEEAARALDHFIEGTPASNLTPLSASGPTFSSVTPDFPNLYWEASNDPRRQNSKEELLREIVGALPEPEMIQHLDQVFVTRCQAPLGNIVHTPTFLRQSERLCKCLAFPSAREQAAELSSHIPMDTLACHLLAVRMLNPISNCRLTFVHL